MSTDPSHLNGQPVAARGGRALTRTDLVEATEYCTALITAGMPYREACKKAKLNTNIYSICRRIVDASKRDDLNEHNAPLIAEALAQIRIGRTGIAFSIFKNTVGINKRRRHKYNLKARFDAFNKAIDVLLNTCEQCTEIIVPNLTSADQTAAVERLLEARRALMSFLSRVRESGHDQSATE